MSIKIGRNISLCLQQRALQLRIDSLRAIATSNSGHTTSCLSAADIISALFFHHMKIDPFNHQNPHNDRFIISKGHAVPIVYAAWKQWGVINDEELMTLRQFTSRLEGHPTPRFKYNEAATGSLGQGLGVGAGMALNARKKGLSYFTYVLLGDAEIAEGSVWEAAAFCAHYRLDNIVAIVDDNRLGQSDESIDAHNTDSIAKKWEAFGWHALVIDGHDIAVIVSALEHAAKVKRQPSVIIAKTYKGYGLDDIADKPDYHGKPIPSSQVAAAITSLKNKFSKIVDCIPAPLERHHMRFVDNDAVYQHEQITLDLATDPDRELFKIGKSMATRKAYGHALKALGKASSKIFALDADVKNSTFSELFEKEYKDRFIQCFIAEQNMVSVATGLQARGNIPFAATFAAFFTRAFDQIRMAAIGRVSLRLVGSHVGVSIGEDGPSQMGLEDIALIRTLPHSIIFYPSDAVSTYKLVECMANYHTGISYLRTTRSATPILYAPHELFVVGGSKVIRQSEKDSVCVVAVGITLYEALKAYEALKKEGLFIAVIDAYSIKPLDTVTIERVARQSGNTIYVVEDHYRQGGLGEAVMAAFINTGISIYSLAVDDISRSGKPEELLHHAKIDAHALINSIKRKGQK